MTVKELTSTTTKALEMAAHRFLTLQFPFKTHSGHVRHYYTVASVTVAGPAG